MNSHMFAHPLTARHLELVETVIGYTVVGPVGKALACGDFGLGAMTEWTEIVSLVEGEFIQPAAAAAVSAAATGESRMTGPSSTAAAPSPPSSPPKGAATSLNLLSPPRPLQRAPSPRAASPATIRPIPVRLKSRWDELISYSTPSTTPPPQDLPPPPPSPSAAPPFDRDSRHPLTLPLGAIERLIADRVLPPTLNHSEHVRPERRLFWFVPSRLEQRQLEGLARATGADAEGGGKRGEWADETSESREWLERCYGEDR